MLSTRSLIRRMSATREFGLFGHHFCLQSPLIRFAPHQSCLPHLQVRQRRDEIHQKERIILAVFTGDNFDNLIDGTEFDDTISGLDGNDTLNGAGGNDEIEDGAGAVTMDAGDDSDTLVHTNFVASVIVDLGLATTSGGHASGDVFSSFEKLTGSAFNDTLFGSAAWGEVIRGANGPDFLS